MAEKLTVRTEKLKKSYGNFNLDVTMELEPGRVTGLIGRNGAGKSTVFKILLGLVIPDGGNAEVFGKNPLDLNRADKEKTGTVLGDSMASGYLNLGIYKKMLRAMYKNFDEELFDELAHEFNLTEGKDFKEYSTGMRAALKTITALTHGADLLILDEPTSGLDIVAREEILSLLRDYMEKNEAASVLTSSHISSDLEGICDDFYVIDEGKIVFHEETHRFLSEYGIIKAEEENFTPEEEKLIVRCRKEKYGIRCLVRDRAWFIDNRKEMVTEKPGFDELITMIVERGNKH